MKGQPTLTTMETTCDYYPHSLHCMTHPMESWCDMIDSCLSIYLSSFHWLCCTISLHPVQLALLSEISQSSMPPHRVTHTVNTESTKFLFAVSHRWLTTHTLTSVNTGCYCDIRGQDKRSQLVSLSSSQLENGDLLSWSYLAKF